MSLINRISSIWITMGTLFFLDLGCIFGWKIGFFPKNGCLTMVATRLLRFVRNSDKWKRCTCREREDYREERLGHDGDESFAQFLAVFLGVEIVKSISS